MSFIDRLKEQYKADLNKGTDKAKAIKERKKEMDAQGVVYCPKCYSENVAPIKKGFGLGKALLGNAIVPGVGLLAGALGKNKIELNCLKCGNKFKAGQ